jgi:hypothetical protein
MAVRLDGDRWTVYDLTTGLPASANDMSLIRLPLEDADNLASLLNHQHAAIGHGVALKSICITSSTDF